MKTRDSKSILEALADEGHVLPTDHRNILTLLRPFVRLVLRGWSEAPSLVQTPAWLPALFAAYCQRLIEENRLDFGVLLHFARKLLTDHPGVTRVLRAGWTHVCVDEFQDTNKAQYDLLWLMVPESDPNLFVVADDDQIIYQWNGASPERLQSLRSDYQMDVLQLPENYRCPKQIIDLANSSSNTTASGPQVRSRSRPAARQEWTMG